jgi:hypothetical protein
MPQVVPAPELALSVHAASNVCVLLITKRPTPTVSNEKIIVIDLFITLFYHFKPS